MVNQSLILMEMKSIIKQNLFITAGILITLYICYLRLIITRLPKDISIKATIVETICYLLITICFVSLFLYTIYKLYKIIYNKSFKTSNNIVVILFKYILQIYTGCLTALDNYIKHTLLQTHLGYYLKTISIVCNKIFNNKRSVNFAIAYFSLDLFPKIFLLLCFTLDTYNHKFNYIYQFACLLLIPLIYRYLVFTFREFSEHNIAQINGVILIYKFHSGAIMTTQDIIDTCKGITFEDDIYASQIPGYTVRVVDLSQEFKQTYMTPDDNLSETLIFYSDQFTFFQKVRRNVDILEKIQVKYDIYFNLIRYLLYSILWLYILVYTEILSYDTLSTIQDNKILKDMFNFLSAIVNKEEPFSGHDI
jgi:hypothetical protein